MDKVSNEKEALITIDKDDDFDGELVPSLIDPGGKFCQCFMILSVVVEIFSVL